MSRSMIALSFSLLVGCGGATQTDLFLDGSAGDSGAGSDGGAGKDGGGADARSDAPGPDCKTLIGKVNDLRTTAIKCDSGSSTGVCNVQVEDLCCPLTVSGPASRPDVAAFEAAVKAAKAAGCQVPCPGVPCSVQPSMKCSNGACQQF